MATAPEIPEAELIAAAEALHTVECHCGLGARGMLDEYREKVLPVLLAAAWVRARQHTSIAKEDT